MATEALRCPARCRSPSRPTFDPEWSGATDESVGRSLVSAHPSPGGARAQPARAVGRATACPQRRCMSVRCRTRPATWTAASRCFMVRCARSHRARCGRIGNGLCAQATSRCSRRPLPSSKRAARLGNERQSSRRVASLHALPACAWRVRASCHSDLFPPHSVLCSPSFVCSVNFF